jgi:SnoaL-like polyketide cyclase
MTACLTFYAEAHQIRSRPSPVGRAGISAFLAGVHATWPGIEIVVEQVVAEGEWVMGRSRATAKHTTDVFGAPATRKQIETTFWGGHAVGTRRASSRGCLAAQQRLGRRVNRGQCRGIDRQSALAEMPYGRAAQQDDVAALAVGLAEGDLQPAIVGRHDRHVADRA